MAERNCVDCGYLAIRDVQSGLLVEVEDSIRSKGLINAGGYQGWLQKYPTCFVRAANLQDEWAHEVHAGQASNAPPAVSVQAVIQKPDRNCESWVEWQQGFSPKEHREMLDRRWERKWRLIELGVLALIGGAFTALGAWIVTVFT